MKYGFKENVDIAFLNVIKIGADFSVGLYGNGQINGKGSLTTPKAEFTGELEGGIYISSNLTGKIEGIISKSKKLVDKKMKVIDLKGEYTTPAPEEKPKTNTSTNTNKNTNTNNTTSNTNTNNNTTPNQPAETTKKHTIRIYSTGNVLIKTVTVEDGKVINGSDYGGAYFGWYNPATKEHDGAWYGITVNKDMDLWLYMEE